MSVSCEQIVDSELLKKVSLYCAKEFVLVNVDEEARNSLPFPSDYNFAPCFLPKKYERYAERIQHFKVRPDDIWVVTYPKSGTTWIMNIVWQLKNNLDFSAAYLNSGYMFLEGHTICEEYDSNRDNEAYMKGLKESDQQLDKLEIEESHRLIKSHLPAHLLPKDIWSVKPRIIYVYRNVKDVAISMYHMFRNSPFLEYQVTLEEHFDLFLNGHVIHGLYHPHVNGFRKLNHFENILLLNYDEMSVDPFSGVKKISDFLGCSYTDDQLEQLTRHVSFKNMQSSYCNPSARKNYNFFRRGKSGAYRDEMSAAYIQKFDEWNEQNQH